MDDERLERRLREDPTMDPVHRIGSFRDRLLERPAGRPTWRPARASRTNGWLAVAAAAVVAIALLAGRLMAPSESSVVGPQGGSAAPTPSGDVLPTALLQAVLDDWGHRGLVHHATLAVVGPRGETWTGSFAAAGESALDPVATARIGEMSRMLLVSAVMSLDECGRGLGYATCPGSMARPPFSIDDRLSRWIPDWPNAEAISVRRLLDGTSGLAPVTSGLTDLLAQVRADPQADWTQDGLIARARRLPPSFAPGQGFAVTDTADLLLDAIVSKVTGRPSLFWIGSSATDHFGLVSTTLAETAPEDLMPGTLKDGSRISDLPSAALTAVGESSGVSSNVLDLARFANAAWSSTSIHDGSTIAAITAVDNQRAYGLGVRGFCPCEAGRPTVVGLTGHAAAWSGVVAKDTVGGWAVAVLQDSDLADSDLKAVLQKVLVVDR